MADTEVWKSQQGSTLFQSLKEGAHTIVLSQDNYAKTVSKVENQCSIMEKEQAEIQKSYKELEHVISTLEVQLCT
jgi:hypothetical protein